MDGQTRLVSGLIARERHAAEAHHPQDGSLDGPGILIIRRRAPGGFHCRSEHGKQVRDDDLRASDVLNYEHLGWDIRDPYGYLDELPFDGTGTPPQPEWEDFDAR